MVETLIVELNGNNLQFLLENKSTVRISSRQRCSVKKGILKNLSKFTGKHLPQGLVFLKKEALTYLFS